MRNRFRAAIVGLAVAMAHAPSSASAAACKIPGFTDAAFGDLGVDVTGNGCTDSYDSSVPPSTYAGTKCSPPGTPCVGGVGTNATRSGAITLSGRNACVQGSCQIGFGGSTANISGGGNCTTTSVEPSTITLGSVTAPALPAASPSAVAAPGTMPAGKTYGAVTGSGNSGSVLSLSTGAYVMSSLRLSGQASIKLTSGPVVVYITGSGSSLDLSGNGVNNTTGLATNLIFMCTDAVTSVTVSGNASAAYAVYCPKAAISVVGNGDIYGAVVGKTVAMNGNGTIHYDKALGNLTSGQIDCSGTTTETSRASPILTTLTPDYGGSAQSVIVQGTFESVATAPLTVTTTSDVAGWSFPYVKGHMRARILSSVTATASAFSGAVCTAASSPSGCSVLFDAGATGKIPAMGTFAGSGCSTPSGTCRHIFSNTNAAATSGTTVQPETTVWSGTGSSAIGPLIAPSSAVPNITAAQQQTIMQKILQGSLGGVDRSTVAVIGPSRLAGSSTRPTIAYFGAQDGMLHAVCASAIATGPCAGRVGTELWAFAPRVQLPLMRKNTQRIDGSPHVFDAYGDFDGDGSASWSTLLVFQTGYGTNATPAVYALDVTDPTRPTIAWETTAPSTAGSVALGTGLTIASGSVGTQMLVVAITTNGGTGGVGVVATALSATTGAKVWQFSYLYPSAPRNVTADGPLPSTAIPGGAVAVDLTSSHAATDFVFGDIYGNLWRLDASTGASRNGASTPLFSFSTNKHPIGAPPAIYSNGNQQYAVFASGGYADHSGSTTWRATTQYVIAARLDSTATTAADETATTCATCAVAFKATMTGTFGFSQALVVGTQLFVSTDSTDVNAASYGATANTGTLRTIELGQRTSTTTVIHAGGTAIGAYGTSLVSSSGQKQQQAPNATNTTGTAVDITIAGVLARLLYLQLD